MDGVRLLADTMSHSLLLVLLVPLAFVALLVLGLAAPRGALRVAERALAAPRPAACDLRGCPIALAATVVSLATRLHVCRP